MNTAGYQLATEKPVLSIGGFNGTDPSPTLDQFQQYVKDGKIHYFIGGESFGPGGQGADGTSQSISDWVKSNYTAETISGVTLYDLTQPQKN